VLRRRRYFQGRSIRGGKDVAWLAPDGEEMNDRSWSSGFVRSIGMLLSGTAIEEAGDDGEMIVGDTLLVLLNAYHDQVPFTLPALAPQQHWQRVFDTVSAQLPDRRYGAGLSYPLEGRSVAVFKVVPPVRERRHGFWPAAVPLEVSSSTSAANGAPHIIEPVGAAPER
jgi:glycogen operon protein